MSRKHADLIFTVLLLGVVAWMVWEAGKWDLRARLFPVAVGIPAIGLALLQFGWLLKASSASHPAASAPELVEPAVSPDMARLRSLHMICWVLAGGVGVVLLGFELGGGLLTFLFLRFVSHERMRTSLLIALVTYLSFYALFDRALVIPFPAGTVAETLGLDKPLDHYVLDPLATLVQIP